MLDNIYSTIIKITGFCKFRQFKLKHLRILQRDVNIPMSVGFNMNYIVAV